MWAWLFVTRGREVIIYADSMSEARQYFDAYCARERVHYTDISIVRLEAVNDGKIWAGECRTVYP